MTLVQPKLWSERDFDECCYAVAGLAELTMVCAAPCRGSYCDAHRRALVESYSGKPPIRRAKVRPIPVPLLGPLWPDGSPKRPPTMDSIIKRIAEKYGVTVAAIKGRCGAHELIPARHEFFYEAHRLGRPYTAAGRFCGGRDHSTALWGKRRHEERLAAATGIGAASLYGCGLEVAA